MLRRKKLEKELWAEAVSCVVYLLNRSPTRNLENITPYEAWYESKPSVRHLKVFRCLAYAHIPDVAREKLDDKTEKCILIGYSESSKAYMLYNSATKKVVISCDVRFNEYSTYDA